MLLRGTVVVDGDTITAVGPAEELTDRYPDRERRRLDIICPGLVQTHVHSVQSPGRGLADDTDLFNWLEDHILLLQNGTTCCVDHLTVDHSERVFKAAARSGIRGVLGKALMDRNAPESLQEPTDAGLAAVADSSDARNPRQECLPEVRNRPLPAI